MDPKSLLWATGRDEEVSVNQRALIDKVLARYSGEYTVYRELLQNSDDAGAKTVEIHLRTRAFLDKSSASSNPSASPSASAELPDLTKELLHQWEFRNDGVPFREEDWSRLKKIAEGNPDEEKIGAFGVGFYSLFSVTDEPFVTSGNQWMGFYWKDNKDQLFARRGALPSTDAESSVSSESRSWTSFTMPLREPSTFPGRPVDIARFLATSLTFMRNLRDVSMFFNEHRLVRVTKNVGHPKNVPLLASLDPKSRVANMMTVKEVQSSDLRIQAKVLRWVYQTGSEKPPAPVRTAIQVTKPTSGGGFFASIFSSFAASSTPIVQAPSPPPRPPTPPANPLESIESSVLLTIYSARVETKLDAKMMHELERATKKKPPTVCWYSLIYTGKDEYDLSKEEDEKEFKATGSVFQGLRADLDGVGTAKVFIGHATSQSTGIGGHISARFIPTVERESIDLVDRQVSVWNKELLWVGGYLCRFIYESQLATIRTLWTEASQATASPDDDIPNGTKTWLEGKALHALQFFTFHPTTPSAIVGLNMEAAFFACNKYRGDFPIISTVGVRSASAVRSWSPELRSFVTQIPMVPESVVKNAPAMLAALREKGMIRDVTFGDVLEELRQRPLTEEQMVECLKWRIGLDTADVAVSHSEELRRQFLQAAVVIVQEPKEGTDVTEEKIVPLSSVKSFISNSNVIPPNLPLPSHTLPFALSKQFKPDVLRQYFGWVDLSIPDWLDFLMAPATLSGLQPDFHVSSSPIFAERVLNVVAKAWGNLPKSQTTRVIDILQSKSVIPTKLGMKTPKEAYFANANVFPDLPIIEMPKGGPVKGGLEKLFAALGVMKHVDLQIVFNRMITTGDWGVQELMKYLVAVRASLSPIELDKLRQTAAFPQEPPPGATDAAPSRKAPSQLYEPTDVLRALGLPLLDWGSQHKWRSNSDEAKLLFEFGLRRFPPLNTILELAAGSNLQIRRKALAYFLENFNRYSLTYQPKDFAELAFIPAIKADGTAFLAKPTEAFIDPECALLGFALVEPSLRNDALTKLKLSKDPSAALIMPIIMRRPPTDPDTARLWFEYLTNRIADFNSEQFMLLRTSPIVPASPPPASDPSAKPHAKQIVMSRPGECFFRSVRPHTSNDVHSKLFTFVDFGNKANNFLRACGVKNEPNIQEIADLLVRDPKRFLELAGGPRNYLDELRQIAAHYTFPPELAGRMKKTPFLLGSRRTPKSGKIAAVADADEEEYDVTFDLLRPDQIVIVDDTNAYSLFCESLFGAPQEDLFEAFYQSLGSRRLSSLITEEYRPQQVETTESPAARDIRNLVLQRFPLFLHERGAQCRVKPDWLSTGNNFIVRGCGKLGLMRKLEFGGKHVVKTQEASAAAKLASSFGSLGPLTLYISKSDNLDMYEIAHSICKSLLKTPRVNDSLLFMTILSTDLRALRRRGFNVDRILHQQRAERELLAARQAAEEKSLQEPLPKPPGGDPFQPPVLPPRPRLDEKASARHSQSDVASTLNEQGPRSSAPPSISAKSPAGQMLSSFKDRIRSSGIGQTGLGGFPGIGPSSSKRPAVETVPRGETAGVTPTRDIERNIQTALNACRAENSSVLNNRKQMATVKESLGDGYCDVSGTDKDFDLIGTISGYKFYVARDVLNPQETAAMKQPVLARFASAVINPLNSVYKLPPTTIHVFYDQRGDLIAFNRNGSIFLNLRYYESWHDAEVQANQPAKALVSWYHSVAHEIAHNLVQPHNSEHEFWFSALCENHLIEFTRLLNRVMT